MNLKVSKEAAEWYKNEMDLKQGDYVQYYVQLYGGIPIVHPNYSLGVSIGRAENIAIKDMVEGITFYFNSDDA
ncbi:HesB/YadR/YfhF family protein [Metabacillus fastidiosus]|uniref:HesB/YadR/YfhF family protein n=1 Tax=Metabacillus fastidiosus TaxID=1458 RepID=UPI003D27F6BA